MNNANLSDISFPVYLIGTLKPHVTDGVMYYLQRHTADSTTTYRLTIVDDKNLPGNLAVRRLKIIAKGDRIHKLKYAVFFLGDLVKLAKKGTWFLDSTGVLFQYTKTSRFPLVYLPIRQVIPIKTGGAIIEVVGMSERFKSLFMPSKESRWAAILKMKKSNILYGFSDKHLKSTTRAV